MHAPAAVQLCKRRLLWELLSLTSSGMLSGACRLTNFHLAEFDRSW